MQLFLISFPLQTAELTNCVTCSFTFCTQNPTQQHLGLFSLPVQWGSHAPMLRTFPAVPPLGCKHASLQLCTFWPSKFSFSSAHSHVSTQSPGLVSWNRQLVILACVQGWACLWTRRLTAARPESQTRHSCDWTTGSSGLLKGTHLLANSHIVLDFI